MREIPLTFLNDCWFSVLFFSTASSTLQDCTVKPVEKALMVIFVVINLASLKVLYQQQKRGAILTPFRKCSYNLVDSLKIVFKKSPTPFPLEIKRTAENTVSSNHIKRKCCLP